MLQAKARTKHNTNFMSDYLPHSDDSLVTWLTNYKTKLAVHGPTLGILAADVAIYQADCDALIAMIHTAASKKAEYYTANQIKKEVKSDKLGNFRSLNNRIKNLPAYSEAIGADLNIIATTTAFDAANAKPIITATLNGGRVVIGFSKAKSNGVKIYCKRSGEAGFTFLSLDTHSPYHDNRTNIVLGTPELREYYAFYIDTTDETFGLQSDTVSIMVN